MMRKAFLILGLLSVLLLSPRSARAGIFINEILFNPPSTDAPNEFVEIFGTLGENLMDVYLVGIEGDSGAANPGDVQTIFNLSSFTFGSNGFLVLRQLGNSYLVDPLASTATGTTTGFGGLTGFSADIGTDIENSSVTFMLIRTTTAPTLAVDIDSNDDGVPDGATFSSWTILDSIGITDASTDFAYGAYNFLRLGSGTTGINQPIPFSSGGYLARTGPGTTDWLASDDSLGGSAPNFLTGSGTNTFPTSLSGRPINSIGTFNLSIGQSVPEPGVIVLLGLGMIGLFVARRFRSSLT